MLTELWIFPRLQNMTGVVKDTARKMKFSIKDFFSKYDQIRCFLRIWSHLRKKSLKENWNFAFSHMDKWISKNTLLFP